jgi:hypothetical protein
MIMHNIAPACEKCKITEALDKNRFIKGTLYAATAKSLMIESPSAFILDKCVECPFGSVREMSFSQGIVEIQCKKWGGLTEV